MFFSRPAGLKYIDRGSIEGFDFVAANFVKDDDWHDLDLSSIIPANAKVVLLNLWLVTSAGTGYIHFRVKDHCATYNAGTIYTSVINVTAFNRIPLAPNKDGIVEYNIFAAATYSRMDLSVNAWFL